jgi:hypothetical protein
MSDRPEDQPGWAVPDQPARDPGGASTPDPASWSWPTEVAPGGATATAPAVPPPYAAPGAPRRPRKRGWIVALIVVLALIVAMGAAGTVLFATRTYPPYSEARDFLSDFGAGRNEATAARLCSADRGAPNRTIQLLRTVVDAADARTLTANALGVDRTNNTARVDFTVSYNGGRKDRTFSLPLVEEHGHWKVCLTGG